MITYNVFLVEDEIVVREGIRNSINWAKTNFNLCGEAPDGDMALSMIHDLKPDIVITDIKMPFMDGFELSKLLKKNMPWVKIIILSGYDEFDFAKTAISIGVTEYLVKPVDSVELLAALEKVVKIIEQEKTERLNLQKMSQEIQSVFHIKKEKMLTDLIMGVANTARVYEFARENDIDLLAKYYMVMEIALKAKADEDYESYLKAKNYIDYMLAEQTEVISFSIRADLIVLIIKGTESGLVNEMAYQIADSVKHELERRLDLGVKIALGVIVERLREVSASYKSAEKTMKHLEAMQINKIMNASDMTYEPNLDLRKLSNISINDKLKHATKDDVPDIVDEYLKNISETEPSSLLMTHYIITEVLLLSSKMISSMGGRPTAIFPEARNPYALVTEIGTKAELRETIKDFLNRTIDFRDGCEGLKYSGIIRSAKDFIEAKYNDADISLKMVASEVALSPNHFSTIFAQETGEKFIEYLTRVRVQKAKDLLKDTNMRASDIAFAVGYKEPHYFSYIFKKSTGLTPRDFRSGAKKPSASEGKGKGQGQGN